MFFLFIKEHRGRGVLQEISENKLNTMIKPGDNITINIEVKGIVDLLGMILNPTSTMKITRENGETVPSKHARVFYKYLNAGKNDMQIINASIDYLSNINNSTTHFG